MIKAVIFDFDGVIAPTMEKHAKSYQEVLSKIGVWINPKAVYLAEGALPEVMLSRLLQKPVDLEIKQLARKKSELFRKHRKYIIPYKEALTLAKKLKKKGYKIAIASGGQRRNGEIILGDQIKIFETYLDGTDVKQHKPDPEVYLKAAKTLKVKPKQCIVIENAPHGITAAKAAGMTCIAITTTLNKEDLEEADFIVNTFKEIENRIEIISKLK
ncbi:HAD family phosphatase [archaeon]|nr:HAD family phosphatase [archaeon]